MDPHHGANPRRYRFRWPVETPNTSYFFVQTVTLAYGLIACLEGEADRLPVNLEAGQYAAHQLQKMPGGNRGRSPDRGAIDTNRRTSADG